MKNVDKLIAINLESLSLEAKGLRRREAITNCMFDTNVLKVLDHYSVYHNRNGKNVYTGEVILVRGPLFMIRLLDKIWGCNDIDELWTDCCPRDEES